MGGVFEGISTFPENFFLQIFFSKPRFFFSTFFKFEQKNAPPIFIDHFHIFHIKADQKFMEFLVMGKIAKSQKRTPFFVNFG